MLLLDLEPSFYPPSTLRTWSDSFYRYSFSIPPSDFIPFIDSLPSLYPYISKLDCLLDCFYLPQFLANYPHNFSISISNYSYSYVNYSNYTTNLEKLIKQPLDKPKLTFYIQVNNLKIPCWTFLLDSSTPTTFKVFTPTTLDTKPKTKRTRKSKSN